MSAAEWRRFREVGGLTQFARLDANRLTRRPGSTVVMFLDGTPADARGIAAVDRTRQGTAERKRAEAERKRQLREKEACASVRAQVRARWNVDLLDLVTAGWSEKLPPGVVQHGNHTHLGEVPVPCTVIICNAADTCQFDGYTEGADERDHYWHCEEPAVITVTVQSTGGPYQLRACEPHALENAWKEACDA